MVETTIDCMRWMFRPFRGTDVRRLAAAILFAVALPRFDFWPGAPVVYPLNILPHDVFAWLALLNAVALVLTAGQWRLRFVGRLAALVAFVTWVLLAAATTSWTSRLIDITLAYAMLGEITAQRGRDV
jgi:hypothetical protein